MSEADRAKVRSWIDESYAVVSTMIDSTLSEINIFASADMDWLSASKCRYFGNAPETLAECVNNVRAGVAGSTAEGGDRFISINWKAREWQLNPDWSKRKIMAHEVFHVFQYHIDGLVKDGETPLDRVRLAGPVWLQEGAAEFIAFKAIDQLKLKTFADSVKDARTRAAKVTHPLPYFQTVTSYMNVDWPGESGDAYMLFMLATDRLLSQAPEGLKSLTHYYRLLGDGVLWPEAFKQAFGLSVEDFHVSYAK